MTEGRNCSTIARVRRLLLVLSGVFLAWAAVVVATGGIQWKVFGVLFRSRDPAPALAIGLLLLLIHATFFRQAFSRDTDRIAAVVRRLLPGLAQICALALVAQAIYYGSSTAGGSIRGATSASRFRSRCRGHRATRRLRRSAIDRDSRRARWFRRMRRACRC